MHPCFSDSSDFRAMGAAETTVELDGGVDVTLGFMVPRPFGPGTDAMLTIRGNRATGTHGLAIAGVIEVDHPPQKPAMDMTLLRNPLREDGDDGTDDSA